METLLTLSLGEYSSVEIALRLTVALIGMTALLLALTATTLPATLRFPLFLSAVALGGAAWFEAALWQSWKEAFELAGTSYCVTGHLIADENRIIAWSLGVPVILFCFGLIQIPWNKRPGYPLETLTVAVLALMVTAPLSSTWAIITFLFTGITLIRNGPMTLITSLVLIVIIIGRCLISLHFSFGGGPSGELVRGEILRAGLDILSLTIPALLLLIGVIRISKTK